MFYMSTTRWAAANISRQSDSNASVSNYPIDCDRYEVLRWKWREHEVKGRKWFSPSENGVESFYCTSSGWCLPVPINQNWGLSFLPQFLLHSLCKKHRLCFKNMTHLNPAWSRPPKIAEVSQSSSNVTCTMSPEKTKVKVDALNCCTQGIFRRWRMIWDTHSFSTVFPRLCFGPATTGTNGRMTSSQRRLTKIFRCTLWAIISLPVLLHDSKIRHFSSALVPHALPWKIDALWPIGGQRSTSQGPWWPATIIGLGQVTNEGKPIKIHQDPSRSIKIHQVAVDGRGFCLEIRSIPSKTCPLKTAFINLDMI